MPCICVVKTIVSSEKYIDAMPMHSEDIRLKWKSTSLVSAVLIFLFLTDWALVCCRKQKMYIKLKRDSEHARTKFWGSIEHERGLTRMPHGALDNSKACICTEKTLDTDIRLCNYIRFCFSGHMIKSATIWAFLSCSVYFVWSIYVVYWARILSTVAFSGRYS